MNFFFLIFFLWNLRGQKVEWVFVIWRGWWTTLFLLPWLVTLCLLVGFLLFFGGQQGVSEAGCSSSLPILDSSLPSVVPGIPLSLRFPVLCCKPPSEVDVPVRFFNT